MINDRFKCFFLYKFVDILNHRDFVLNLFFDQRDKNVLEKLIFYKNFSTLFSTR